MCRVVLNFLRHPVSSYHPLLEGSLNISFLAPPIQQWLYSQKLLHYRPGATQLPARQALFLPMPWSIHWTCTHKLTLPCDSEGNIADKAKCSVKTRLQVQVKSTSKSEPSNTEETTNPADQQHYNGTWDAITRIVKEDGPLGLYAGITGSLIGVASTNFAYFYWYSIVRTLYLKYQTIPKPPGTVVELSLGAIAGALAQLFTIPVSVVTTRQQTQPKNERKGLFATAREVIDGEDGWTGLWRGLKASLVLVVNPSITYGAYQRLRVLFYPGKAQLRPHEAFRECRLCLTIKHISLICLQSSELCQRLSQLLQHSR